MNKLNTASSSIQCISFSAKIATMIAVLTLAPLQSKASEIIASENSEPNLVEKDKRIAGKLHSTLHFESIKLNVPSAVKIDKGVVSIDSDKLDMETVEKIKIISRQIQEVVTVVTKSSS